MRHKLTFLALALVLLAALSSAGAALWRQDELLEPEKAFQISTRALDAHNVEVRFRIADGYYMYRDRFKFETADGKLIADVELPPGKVKKDPFFGETQTYRREAVIRVPVADADADRGRMTLKVTSQGCADSGVCYVPLEQSVNVDLAGGTTAAAAAPRRALLPAVSLQPWAQALAGAFALIAALAALRLTPSLGSLRRRVARLPWFYPASAFGVASLLILASYPLLADPIHQLAWGALLVVLAVSLRATDPLPHGAGGAYRFGKGIGVLALASGVMLLAFGAGWHPANRSMSTASRPLVPEPPRFERIASVAELDTRVRSGGRPTMLDFYADWCVTCKEMERFTFSNPAVRARMQDMQLLQADVTRNTADDKALLQRFGIFGPPAIIFFDEGGNEIRSLRVIGFQPADRFGKVLDDVLRGRNAAQVAR